MDYDLAIIGAGFWGTAAAVKAREQGMEPVVLDNLVPWSSSRNAAGMVHMDWITGESSRKLLPAGWSGRELGESVAWLMRYGLQHTGETFRGFGGEEKRHKETFMMPDVAAFLALGQATRAEVSHMRRLKSGGWRIYADSESVSIDARRVILAAGIGTDTLLAASSLPRVGVTALRGRGMLVKIPSVRVASLVLPYRIRVGRYGSYTLRAWPCADGPLYRWGDTTESGNGNEPIRKMAEALTELVGPYDWVGTHEGYRPVCAQYTVKPVADGMVVATGGHRIGLGLAGIAADKALALLKARLVT